MDKYRHMPSIVQDALSMPIDNALLVDYCIDHLATSGLETPPELYATQQKLTTEVDQGRHLRWLDVPLTARDSQLRPSQVREGKIARTLAQLRRLQAGVGFMCYVAVPALNEEIAIGRLIDSLQQPYETPLSVVVADNNSTDGTAKAVHIRGGNVISALKPGVGAARQTATDHILATTTSNLDRTVLVQTDADCLPVPNYVDSVVEEFTANSSLQVGIGPSVYTMLDENSTLITLASGKEYGAFLGTQSLSSLFETVHRQPSDYLLEPPYRYLIGPNTTFRASLFTQIDLRYPEDGRWETLDLSIRLQHQLPSSTAIGRISMQEMRVSSRAITGGRDRLTSARLAQIRQAGYVGMYKTGGVVITPVETTRQTLHELDQITYELKDHELIMGIVSPATLGAGSWRTTPALHAATGLPIAGKVAVIAQR